MRFCLKPSAILVTGITEETIPRVIELSGQLGSNHLCET